jgi:hypothetical protein
MLPPVIFMSANKCYHVYNIWSNIIIYNLKSNWFIKYFAIFVNKSKNINNLKYYKLDRFVNKLSN